MSWQDAPCRIWGGGKTNGGYGTCRASNPRRVMLVHRKTWEDVHGDIPDGMQILHHCDNRLCYEITHLFMGTQQDNMRDMRSKLGGDRLSIDEVREIKDMFKRGISTRDVAEKYGLSTDYAGSIRRGYVWGWV